jgi:RHS repeat-associated protein
LTYDVENRVIQAVNSNGTEQYGYSPDNRRVYRKLPSGAGGSQLIYFYGANGDRLATYVRNGPSGFLLSKTDLYFAGRRLAVMDRLGSVRGNKYLPFGEEQPATANDTDKFATYFRDSSTGLDYALNRYYSSSMGRFLTPDPFGRSAKAPIPQTWNRYTYVANDPVNLNDRSGLDPFDGPDIGFSATFVGWMAVWMAAAVGPGALQSTGPEGAPTPYHPLLTTLLRDQGPSPGVPRPPAEPTLEEYLPGIGAAIDIVVKALAKSECGGLFGLTPGASLNPADLLQDLRSGGARGSVISARLEGRDAESRATGTMSLTGNPNYYANMNGDRVQTSSVTIAINYQTWNWHTVDGRARILVHELGHVFNMLQGAGGSKFVYDLELKTLKLDPSAQAINDALTKQCIP